MMSRRTNNEPDKRVRRLEKKVDELLLDLNAIENEHERYRFGGVGAVESWINCLPIETLRESLNRQHGMPRTKLALGDLKHKFGLRKLHDVYQSKLEQAEIELNVAKIDKVLEQIGKIK
jgi:hypothetical protein